MPANFLFTATIYKTGINLCVDVPGKVSAKMKPVKGYIPVKGMINKHPFVQTLVPVKDGPYRLFVNGPMLKASGVALGDKVKFTIEQNFDTREEPFPVLFKKALTANSLAEEFDKLSASRRKEVLRYLNNLKTKESLARNIEKVIVQLQKKDDNAKGFLRAVAKS